MQTGEDQWQMCDVSLYVSWVEGTGTCSIVFFLHQKNLIDL